MPRIRFLVAPEAADLKFAPPEGVREVTVPEGTTLLEAAEAAGAQVGSACGGNCACSTCHVYVVEGLDSLSEQEESEEDILDKAFDVKATSRLACQAQVGAQDLVCVITRESRQAFFDENPNLRIGGPASAHRG